MKFLIVGLGNVGFEYQDTRHNIGFMMADALADVAGVTFEDKRYGAIARMRVKNAELVLLKPSTLMNLSGNAVRYWMNKENVPIERVLVLVDDLALKYGELRLKAKGADAGHNGLKHIAQTLASTAYPRLRFGIGNDFSRGGQVDFVLSPFSREENQLLPECLKRSTEIVRSFCLAGIDRTMNQYNRQAPPTIAIAAEAVPDQEK